MQKIHSALLALAAFFSSKENWTAIIGAAAFFSAKYGWGVDSQSLWAIGGLTIALLTHSALANHGSVAALANQETARLQLEHARLTARLAGASYDKPELERRNSQSGSAALMALASLAFVAAIVCVGACAWWSSSGKPKAKAGGKAATGCLLGDVGKYLGDYQQALGSDGYDAALSDVEKKNNLTTDLTTCAVETIFSVLTARPAGATAPSTSEPSPVVLHAQTYLAKHGAAK